MATRKKRLTQRQQINEREYKYRRSLRGVLCYAYTRMFRRVSGHGHASYTGLAICTRQEFYSRFETDADFVRLWTLWRRISLADRRASLFALLTPDRIEPARGYVLDNIRWQPYLENVTRALLQYRRAQSSDLDARL